MIKKFDKENSFVSMFDPKTGFYMRSGVIENGKDTGEDPFMASFPELLDIGVMQTCVCSKRCNVDCYQKAIERTGNNMPLSDFESILKQCQGKRRMHRTTNILKRERYPRRKSLLIYAWQSMCLF